MKKAIIGLVIALALTATSTAKAWDLYDECSKGVFHCVTYIVVTYVTGETEEEWNDSYDELVN